MKRIALILTSLGILPVGVQAQTLAARLSRPIEYWNPDWSPDGRTLIFESTLSGNSSIYAINADGSSLRRLTADTSESYQARWSPDGRRIVFSSERDGGTQIYTMNADGSAAVRLTLFPGGGYYQSSFSPDGNWIAFQGRPDNRETRDRVWAMRSDGSQLRLLSDTTKGAEGPEWLADSRTVRFHQVPYPKRYWSEMVEAEMTAAKSAARDLVVRVDGSGLAPAPAASKSNRPAEVPNDAVATPDARRFAFTKTVDGFAALYVYDVATKRERMLTGGAGAGPLGYLRTTLLPVRARPSTPSPARAQAAVRARQRRVLRSFDPADRAEAIRVDQHVVRFREQRDGAPVRAHGARIARHRPGERAIKDRLGVAADHRRSRDRLGRARRQSDAAVRCTERWRTLRG